MMCISLLLIQENENEYKIDGSWKAFESKEIKILVKVLFGIKVNIKMKNYLVRFWSSDKK